MKRIFVTGATGFLGQAIVKNLLDNHYDIVGLARNESSAAILESLGATAHIGSLQGIDSILAGIKDVDAVIHTAFNHDFATYKQNCEDDRHIILAMGKALNNTSRPLIVTSGAWAIESHSEQFPRAASDEAALACHKNGTNCMIVGLSQVHDTHKFGLISPMLEIAQSKQVSAYIENTNNKWAAVHLSDAANLYRLVLENGQSGHKYIAAGEENIPFKSIMQTIGDRLNIPTHAITKEEARDHFGHYAHFAELSLNASGEESKKKLGWEPKGASLLNDISNAVLS
ncbi:SDR family oxidoreductase [Marinomonas sp.]|uniref:SDR family oxidoreductase n=1 Tax=Marinomonas sp. TaxID=1904862 RepID=UPI003BA99CD8